MSQDFDVAIIGGGIAGLSAALTVARLGRSAVILAGGLPGGELVKIGKVDGIPGHEDGISGYDLCPITQELAEDLGVELMDETATSIVAGAGNWQVSHKQGEIVARGLIIASGTSLAELDVPGIDRLRGKGVSDCASCDAPLLRNKVAIVAGGGDSAMQEALVLLEHLEKVIMVVQGEALSGQKTYIDAIQESPKIEFRFSTVPTEVLGDNVVTQVKVKNVNSGDEELIEADAIFYLYRPRSQQQHCQRNCGPGRHGTHQRGYCHAQHRQGHLRGGQYPSGLTTPRSRGHGGCGGGGGFRGWLPDNRAVARRVGVRD